MFSKHDFMLQIVCSKLWRMWLFENSHIYIQEVAWPSEDLFSTTSLKTAHWFRQIISHWKFLLHVITGNYFLTRILTKMGPPDGQTPPCIKHVTFFAPLTRNVHAHVFLHASHARSPLNIFENELIIALAVVHHGSEFWFFWSRRDFKGWSARRTSYVPCFMEANQNDRTSSLRELHRRDEISFQRRGDVHRCLETKLADFWWPKRQCRRDPGSLSSLKIV